MSRKRKDNEGDDNTLLLVGLGAAALYLMSKKDPVAPPVTGPIPPELLADTKPVRAYIRPEFADPRPGIQTFAPGIAQPKAGYGFATLNLPSWDDLRAEYWATRKQFGAINDYVSAQIRKGSGYADTAQYRTLRDRAAALRVRGQVIEAQAKAQGVKL